MGTSTAAKYVKCPYYKKHDAIRVVCEGIFETNTLHLVFLSAEDRKQWMGEQCDSILGCRDCPIHMLLDQKYEECTYE